MKQITSLAPALLPSFVAALTLAVVAALASGCATGSNISGSYQTPQSDIAVSVGLSTNGVDISGAYSNTNQVISGAFDLQK